MKRTLCAILTAVFLSVLCIPCAAADTAIPKTREFSGFTDVADSAWYADAVRLCYETGVLDGTGAGLFSPNAPLTAAQLEALAAKVSWRLGGNEGDLPDAPAETGAVKITLSSGQDYALDHFFIASTVGLGGRTLPSGDFIVTLSGDAIQQVRHPYITLTVDGSFSLRGTFDAENSFDPLLYMYRFHVSGEDALRHDPVCRVETRWNAKESTVGQWYWKYDHYLNGLTNATVSTLPNDLTAPATRLDAAHVISLIAPNRLLTPLSDGVPPDTQDEAVLRLYRAGVLSGVDEKGSFRSADPLTRAQSAVILARLLQPDLRVSNG